MTTSHIKDIHDAIGEAAKAAGFVKSGGGWFAQRTESTLAISPQRSQYGEQYYLNLGVYFKALGVELAPKRVERFHLQARISDVARESGKAIDTLFDFECPQDASERKQRIVALLRDDGLRFLESCSTIQGARAEYVAGKLDALPIVRSLREILDTPNAL